MEGGRVRYSARGRELLVTIPPGIRPGRRIRLKGMGEEGRGGGEPGNLYITIRIRNPIIQGMIDLVKRLLGWNVEREA
jgi:DnaJ-class molecular chaperone